MSVQERLASKRSVASPRATGAQFDELWRRSHTRALGLAKYIVRDEALAEDVTQEAFLRAWQHMDSLDTGRQAEAWVLRIVRNVAIDHLRRGRTPIYHSLDHFDSDGTPLDPPDTAAGPEELATTSATADTLWHAVSHLPALHRDVLLLAASEQFTYEEIARRMDCPLGTVRSRIHRARETLRQRLVRDGVIQGKI